MYPGGQGDYGSPGLGLLRLHSTHRHDLKIYASDEGRVQMTAAAFAKVEERLIPCFNNGLSDTVDRRLYALIACRYCIEIMADGEC